LSRVEGRYPDMAFQVTIQPSGHRFLLEPGETLLDGALREGYGLPYGCRSGACGTCKGRIVSGAVDYGEVQSGALTEAEKIQGKALFCRAKPLSEVVIEAREVAAVRDILIKKLPCRVERVERLNHDVAEVNLKLPGDDGMRFLAGQYIDILLKDGKRRSFSLANPPQQDQVLQIHVRNYPGGKFSHYVFCELQERTILRLEGPLGTFFLREDSLKPMLFMAGGTGFAPIKSIIEYALRQSVRRNMTLYWGARSAEDLYMAELPRRWQEQHSSFRFIPVLSEPKPGDRWTGRRGLVHQALAEDFSDLSGYQVYACGPPAMVDAGHRLFTQARGLPDVEFYSDPFTISVDVPPMPPGP
jgi:CDP-4-dehydro-6-deoxyglucose reductase, E3